MSGLILELQEKTAECLHIHDDVQVLQHHLDVYCRYIESELYVFLEPTQENSLTTENILRLLDVLVAFHELAETIKAEKQGHMLLIPAGNRIRMNISFLSKRYVQNLREALNNWLSRIRSRLLRSHSNRALLAEEPSEHNGTLN